MQESWAWIAVGTCKRGVESLADITHVIEPERGPEFAHGIAREPYRWALLLSLLHVMPFPTFPQSCNSPRGANALTPPSKTSNSSSLVACRMDGGSKVGSRGGGSRFPRLVLGGETVGEPLGSDEKVSHIEEHDAAMRHCQCCALQELAGGTTLRHGMCGI